MDLGQEHWVYCLHSPLDFRLACWQGIIWIIICACCIGFDYLLGVLVLLFQSAAVSDLAEVASDPWKALNFAN